jgi:hypothetical protein
MRISWILWWIISAIELFSFIGFSILLWLRNVDAAGAVQTAEIKWINIGVIAAAYLIPFIIQIIWLVINLIISRKEKQQSLS